MRWIDNLRDASSELLPAPVTEYFNQGSAACVSTGEAEAGWDALRLRPRVLRDVSTVSSRTAVLGRTVETSILVAPSTLQRLAHPDGELATARAAADAGALLEVSTNAGTTFEELGRPDEDYVKADDLTFADIAWLCDRLGLPVVVKGVLRGDDASVCAAAVGFTV